MVTPESSGTDERNRRRSWAMVAGLLGVVAGLVAIFALTQPDPPPTADDVSPTTPSSLPRLELPSTTTTEPPFQVADIVSGPQIEWVGIRELTDQAVITVMPRGDDFYLFTTQRATYPDWQVNGMDVWRLRDNSWLLLSSLPSEFAPQQVIETSDGFLALGTEPNGAPLVWISPDATKWDRIPLPWEEGTYVSFNNVVATDDLVVIGAFGQKDPNLLVAQAVAEHYPHLRGELRDYSDREPIIVLTVPPFIPVVVVEPEDLGLTAPDLQSDWRFDRLTFIGTDGGRRWKRVVSAEDYGTWINPAFQGPDEMIWGRNPSGALFRSADGLAWEPMDADLPDSMTAWESRVIGVESYGGRGTPSLQTSTDLMFWADLPVPDVLSGLPRRDAEYWDPVLAAGDGGVALAVRTTEHSTRSRDPVRLERDGYTMFAGPTGLFLLKGATPIIRDWEPAPDLWIPARLTEDGASVIFSDPETRVDLVTFSLAELEEVGAGWHQPEPVVIANDRHVLFFSPDGETWTIQDLSGIATAYGPTNIAVGTESMLVVTSDFWSAKVWVGQLPPTP